MIVAVSTRGPGSSVRYVASELARRFGAAPEQDTESAVEAYRGTSEPKLLRYREGDLP